MDDTDLQASETAQPDVRAWLMADLPVGLWRPALPLGAESGPAERAMTDLIAELDGLAA